MDQQQIPKCFAVVMMFSAHPSFWSQLWDKGVDIWANIIANFVSAGLLGGLGLLIFNPWSKKREKQEQTAEKTKHYFSELQNFAEAADKADIHNELVAVAESWVRWIEGSPFLATPANLERTAQWRNASSRILHECLHSTDPKTKISYSKSQLTTDILNTKIPPILDRT